MRWLNDMTNPGDLAVCPRCGEFEAGTHTKRSCNVHARRLRRMALVHALWELGLWL